MTTYFTVPLLGFAPNPFVGSVIGATGSVFVPGAGQTAKLTMTSSPARGTAPSFTPTLDGVAYTCYAVWSLFGQRYYVNCYDDVPNLVFSVALVETPESILLESLSWSPASLQVTAITKTPHGLPVGIMIDLTITDVPPDAFNGAVRAFITSPTSFQYPLNTDPGTPLGSGSVSYLISLCKGYFNSTMVFRNGQFEVSP